jgi:hypothetical protein
MVDVLQSAALAGGPKIVGVPALIQAVVAVVRPGMEPTP